MSKTDNRHGALKAKAELRRNVLAMVDPANVLDVYCGESGAMHAQVWKDACAYSGIDERWNWRDDARRRYVGDAHTILRAIDLHRFNLFDVDAYGDPWPAMLIIGARKKWRPDEIYAAVTTEAGQLNKFNRLSNAQAQLIGAASRISGGSGSAFAKAISEHLPRQWLEMFGMRLIKMWRAYSPRAQSGNVQMTYTAMIFSPKIGSERCL